MDTDEHGLGCLTADQWRTLIGRRLLVDYGLGPEERRVREISPSGGYVYATSPFCCGWYALDRIKCLEVFPATLEVPHE